MKTVNSLSIPSVRLLIDDIQRELWWDEIENRWDRHKPWSFSTLQLIGELMACAGLMPEEVHRELPESDGDRQDSLGGTAGP